MSDLYTLICEFAGGTYIAQLTAGSPRDAVTLWLGSSSARKYIPKESRVQLKKDLKDDPPVHIMSAGMFGAAALLQSVDWSWLI